MRSPERKLVVLHLLSQEKGPISLPDLLLKLPETFAERSVRRWLNELVSEGLVTKSGAKRGTLYLFVKGTVNNQAVSSRC